MVNRGVVGTPPTDKQLEVHRLAFEAWRDGRVITVGEIARQVGVGWRATHDRIRGLSARGYLSTMENRSGLAVLKDLEGRDILRWEPVVK